MSVFKGSAVAIITPFTADGRAVNYDVLAEIIDDQIAGGTDAIVICGSTGEAATMTEMEHVEAIKFTVEYTKKRVPVIAGTGSNSTETAIWLSEKAVEYGADALLLVSPDYNKATQEGLYLHYRAVAEASGGTPLLLYNVPSRTGVNILPETIAKLVKDVPNVAGVKEASGNISQIGKLMALTDGNIELYSGNDDQVVPILALGGLGVISVVANVAPRAMHDMCFRFFEGDIAGAAKLQRRTQELFEQLFIEVNPIPVKKAMNLLGYAAGPLRMPLTELTPAHTESLKKAMADFGLL